jgi:PIN domain nuclease of toxin-antitoxin system
VLVAQATEEGLTIVTGDPQLKHYDVTIIMS